MCYSDNVDVQIPENNKGYNPSNDPLTREQHHYQCKLDLCVDSVRAKIPKTKNDQNKSKAPDGKAES